MAAVGMITELCRVSSSNRAFTNWFGNSAISLFSNTPLNLTVPVVWSIWLSMVSSVPVASLRLQIAIVGLAPAESAPAATLLVTSGKLSSAILKITAIGCNCVITARPFTSVAWTILPWSTSRNPMRPVSGEVMCA